ncbi:hypothetical protein ABEB36_010220 [Hypothenemus hampei]|uniref:Uncharacterized protein n=1 Tax=Hypothenemus hampei TaxID=57062 RepID=A0ABD1EJ42_HYPHA
MVQQRFFFLFLIYVSYSCSANSDYLFSIGWYKTSRKSHKVPITHIKDIGPEYFPGDGTYLKIGAKIPVLKELAVHDFEKLLNLNIRSCGILDIHPGAFQFLPKLLKLNLNENDIQHIRKGVFNNLNITFLTLNKNNISIIDSDAFDDMPLLKKVKLSTNRISVWDPKWFKNTPSLAKIWMKRNSLETLPAKAFVNLKENNLVEGGNAGVSLYFKKNKIQKIDPQTFSDLKALRHIFLEHNNLTVLPKNLFEGIENIQIVSVTKNNLSYIDEDLFTGVKRVKNFYLLSNHKIQCVPDVVAKVVENIFFGNMGKLNCTCVRKLSEYTNVISLDTLCPVN